MNASSFLSFAAVVLSLGGCGSDAAPDLPPEPRAGSSSNEVELARIQAALGEPTCGTTAADAVLAVGDPAPSAHTQNGTYGHPDCTNGFVVDVPGARAGMRFRGGKARATDYDAFRCLPNVGYLSLWQKQGTAYVRVAEQITLGTFTPSSGTDYPGTCAAWASVTVPSDGDYRLVSSAAWLFGPHQRTDVYLVPPPPAPEEAPFAGPVCGNGLIDAYSEICDGDNVLITCQQQGYLFGGRVECGVGCGSISTAPCSGGCYFSARGMLVCN